LGQATYPDVLDPQKATSSIDVEALTLCYEGLTTSDNKGTVGPGSADIYNLSTDGRSMTFHIRDGLKRADGTAMNASDFAYALKREVDPRITGKQYTDLVRDVQGAAPLIDSEGKKLSDDELSKLYATFGVKADDTKRELVITFNRPIGFWSYIASTTVTFSPDKKTADAIPDNWWIGPDGHNCNGPFKFKSIEANKRIVYEANSNYWRGRPKIDRIEITYVNDEVERLEAYKRGELDQVAVTAKTLNTVLNDSNLQSELARYPSALTVVIGFNNVRKPFDDKNVRIAFSQALDREGWIRDVQKGIGKPFTRWIPPGVSGGQPDKPGVPAYDPKAAVDTLLKNGYASPDGKKVDCAKLGDLELAYPESPESKLRFQFLKGNFEIVFNCPVPLKSMDPSVYAASLRDPKTNPRISRRAWIQDYPSPQNWLSLYWECDTFAKLYSYCNKDLDGLLSKADATTNFSDSLKMYQDAEDLLLRDVPAAPVSYSENLYLIKPYLIGPKENLSSYDYDWAGQWGPVWTYNVDLGNVPGTYPRQ
jgi:oligopeptide transport system substrate-binding protein